VVVSLSTLPSRIGLIRPVLNSLLDQEEPADEIVLVLPQASAREGGAPYEIAPDLARCAAVTILRCERDWGPATKLIPVLERECDPATLVVAVDDDNVYPPALVANLLRWSARLPDAALGHRGWSLTPSRDWRDTITLHATGLREPRAVDVVTGTWGLLVRPRFFDAAVRDYDGWPEDAFFNDDIWFNGHLARRRVPRVVVPLGLPPISTTVSRVNGLCYVANRDGAHNNAVIQAFGAHW